MPLTTSGAILRGRQGDRSQRALRHHRRGVVCAVAIGLCAIALSACGGSATNQKTSAHQKKTITVWQFWTGYAPNLPALSRKLDAEFEARYPQYKVVDVPIAYSEMGTKLTAAIAAGAGPDVVTTYPGVVAAGYRNGLVPLQKFLTPTDRRTWRLLDTAASPGGDMLAVPWTEFGSFILYNKELFTKAGLDPNAPPATMDQFINDCRVFASHGITALSGGFKDGYEWEWWAFPLLDQLMSPATSKSFLNYNYPMTGSAVATAWSDVKALAPCYAKDAYARTLFNDAYTDFDAGKAAMLLDESLDPNTLAAQHAVGERNFGLFPVPRLASSNYSPNFVDAGAYSGWGITKWSDPASAWNYVSWMESKQVQEQLFSQGGTLPNNTQAATPTNNPAIRKILADLRNPENHSVYLGFPISVLAINERYAGEMFRGQVSISSVLQQMEQLRQQLRAKVAP
jgi:multiple sugar transport system substrate-binding protein